MIELLPNLVDKYFAEGKDNQADRTKEYWDNWFEKHSEDIKALKAVAEDLKQAHKKCTLLKVYKYFQGGFYAELVYP